MNDQEGRGAAKTAESSQDDHLAPQRQDRPPVDAFDPHFGSRSGGGRDSSDFDDMMWERAA